VNPEILIAAYILITIPAIAAMLFILLSALSFLYGAPFVPADPEAVSAALKLAKLRKGERFYDLGSGDGRAVLAASDLGAKAVGVEINPLLWLWGACRSVFSGRKANFLLLSFYDVDLRNADVVFIYTWQWTNEKLEGKLKRELKKGARVVSHRFTFPNWKPAAEDRERRLLLYVKE